MIDLRLIHTYSLHSSFPVFPQCCVHKESRFLDFTDDEYIFLFLAKSYMSARTGDIDLKTITHSDTGKTCSFIVLSVHRSESERLGGGLVCRPLAVA